jgi:hypothetical protein
MYDWLFEYGGGSVCSIMMDGVVVTTHFTKEINFSL